MSYNEERLEIAQLVEKLAAVGFMAEVREIAEALSICPKGDVKVIAKRLTLLVQAMDSVETDVEYYKGKCKKEDL